MKTSSPVNNSTPSTLKSPTLRCYEIPRIFLDLMERIVDDEGIVSEAGLAELNDLIKTTQSAAASLGCYIRQIELESEAVSAVAKAATQRADRLSSQAKRWREHLLNALDAAGITQIKGDPRISISVRNNPPSVAIYEERDIPPTYWRITQVHELDKGSIKEALKSGKDVAGCSLVIKRRIQIT